MGQKVKDIIFIVILGAVCVGLLLGIKNYTLPKIKRYEEIQLKSTILEAAGISYTIDDLDETFNKKIKAFTKDDFPYYRSPNRLYIFEFEGRGLWGMIKGVLTLRPDLETIENVNIVSQEETPGLGGRISEKAFLDTFRNKKVLPEIILALRQKATKINEIDAISGASISSDALVKIINEHVKKFRMIMEK